MFTHHINYFQVIINSNVGQLGTIDCLHALKKL